MTDDVDAQIDALASAMSTMPGLKENSPRTVVSAPARRRWAKELIEKWGVSIDPAKATVEVVATGPAMFGPHGPREVRDKTAENAAVNRYIRAKGPDFLAVNQPELAERIRAAKTPAQTKALQEELREKLKNDPNALIYQVLRAVEGISDDNS